ncbi:hypothetical protein Scep_019834 [Stephania cephalantha]|uniref:Pectate lyase n=1 Tax=Stephania cephalantha TaxID=152367 RepID=A0AAP0NNP5_9MAGN
MASPYDAPGSLPVGCCQKEPLWIVFDVSGTIHLSSYLSVSSYKTIDGRGQRVKFTGKGLRLKECENIIIIYNLEFEGGRGHDVDGIQIKLNSKHIWIDRCNMRDYDDGLINITRQSTDITISSDDGGREGRQRRRGRGAGGNGGGEGGAAKEGEDATEVVEEGGEDAAEAATTSMESTPTKARSDSNPPRTATTAATPPLQNP